MSQRRSIAFGVVVASASCTRVVVVPAPPPVVTAELEVAVEPVAPFEDEPVVDAPPVVRSGEAASPIEPHETRELALSCTDTGCAAHAVVGVSRCGTIGQIVRFTPAVRGDAPEDALISIAWSPAAQLAVWDDGALAIATTGTGRYLYRRTSVPATIDVQVKAPGGDCSDHQVEVDILAGPKLAPPAIEPQIDRSGGLAEQHVPVLWDCDDLGRVCRATASTLIVTCPRRPATDAVLTPPAPPSRATADRIGFAVVFPAGPRTEVYADGNEVARSAREGTLSLDLPAPFASIVLRVRGHLDRCETYPYTVGLGEWTL